MQWLFDQSSIDWTALSKLYRIARTTTRERIKSRTPWNA
jgi:hypothetical protein